MRRLSILMAMALTTALLTLLGAAPANAYGDQSNCRGHTYFGHTNRWTVFLGHHMDVNLRGCSSVGSRRYPPHLIWVRPPRITFPGRFGTAWMETVRVTQAPYVASVTYNTAGPTRTFTRVTYRYQVRQCSTLAGGGACNDFVFRVSYNLWGSHICFVGGSCDDRKRW